MSDKSPVLRTLGAAALLIVLVLVVVYAVQFLSPRPADQAASAPYPAGQGAYPPPLGTVDPNLHLTATAEVGGELAQIPPTSPPATLLPTPVVTPFPVAAPPLVQALGCPPAGGGTVIFRQGSALLAAPEAAAEAAALTDLQAERGLFLAGDAVGVHGSDWISLSPDGRAAALVVSADPGPPEKGEPPIRLDIYRYDLETGELTLLVEDARAPSWSPDGSRLAYLSGQALMILDSATGESREVYAADAANEHTIKSLDWSPDGQAIVFIDEVFRQQNAIKAVDVQSRAVLFEVDHPMYFTYTPRWSPDGRRILYVTSDGASSTSERFSNLWVMGADGSGRAQVTQDIEVLSPPLWSPDGSWAVFAGWKGYEQGAADYDLWLVDPSSAELRRLTATDGVSELSPAWSPDCSALYFAEGESGLGRISLVDGSRERVDAASGSFVIAP